MQAESLKNRALEMRKASLTPKARKASPAAIHRLWAGQSGSPPPANPPSSRARESALGPAGGESFSGYSSPMHQQRTEVTERQREREQGMLERSRTARSELNQLNEAIEAVADAVAGPIELPRRPWAPDGRQLASGAEQLRQELGGNPWVTVLSKTEEVARRAMLLKSDGDHNSLRTGSAADPGGSSRSKLLGWVTPPRERPRARSSRAESPGRAILLRMKNLTRTRSRGDDRPKPASPRRGTGVATDAGRDVTAAVLGRGWVQLMPIGGGAAGRRPYFWHTPTNRAQWQPPTVKDTGDAPLEVLQPTISSSALPASRTPPPPPPPPAAADGDSYGVYDYGHDSVKQRVQPGANARPWAYSAADIGGGRSSPGRSAVGGNYVAGGSLSPVFAGGARGSPARTGSSTAASPGRPSRCLLARLPACHPPPLSSPQTDHSAATTAANTAFDPVQPPLSPRPRPPDWRCSTAPSSLFIACSSPGRRRKAGTLEFLQRLSSSPGRSPR